MKRLFLAINIPDEIKDELCDLRITTPEVSWVRWQNYHLTLKFLGGAISSSDEMEIIRRVSQIKMEPFNLRLSSVGFFGSEKKPRILWCGVSEEPSLRELNKRCSESLASLGLIKKSDQIMKFYPHVTLGRPKKLRYEKVAEFLQTFSTYRSEVFPIDSFYLMRSDLTSEGAVYTVEEEFKLL
jgi:2'-5' RNA ligase